MNASRQEQAVKLSDHGSFQTDSEGDEVSEEDSDGSALPRHLKNNTLVLLMGRAFTNLILKRIQEF